MLQKRSVVYITDRVVCVDDVFLGQRPIKREEVIGGVEHDARRRAARYAAAAAHAARAPALGFLKSYGSNTLLKSHAKIN